MEIFQNKKLLFYLLLLIAATSAYAQSHPILGKFFVSETKGSVFLSWSIIAGSTCNGIQIYRSVDGINFSQVGEIAGVCGSANFEQPYSFTDNTPVKNKVNYYRLELGSQGISQTVSIEIVDIENSGYQIRPQPANAETKIYFNNNNRKEQQLTLYNVSGIEISTSTTNEDFFKLNTSLLPSGLYFFTISISGTPPTIKGKLLVQH